MLQIKFTYSIPGGGVDRGKEKATYRLKSPRGSPDQKEGADVCRARLCTPSLALPRRCRNRSLRWPEIVGSGAGPGSRWLPRQEELPADTRGGHGGLPAGAVVIMPPLCLFTLAENKVRLWIRCFFRVYGFFSGRIKLHCKEV